MSTKATNLYSLMFLDGSVIDKKKNTQEKRHQRHTAELKKETKISRFLDSFRKFGEEFNIKSLYESEPWSKVFSRMISTKKLSLISYDHQVM